jgi:hypothetical protein
MRLAQITLSLYFQKQQDFAHNISIKVLTTYLTA